MVKTMPKYMDVSENLTLIVFAFFEFHNLKGAFTIFSLLILKFLVRSSGIIIPI